MELNREQIIKALECCKKDDCDNCPNDFGNCYANLAGYSIALIKELTEENGRLEAAHAMLLGATEEKARADAITEFAERLKKYYRSFDGKTSTTLAAYHIDQIKQEMLKGDSNDNN